MRWITAVCALLLATGCGSKPDEDGADGDSGTTSTPTGTGTTGTGTGGTTTTGSLAGTISLDGSVTCGTAAADDCFGLLTVLVLPCGDPTPDCLDPPWLGELNQLDTDLGAGPASYQVDGLPGDTDVFVVVSLYETATMPLPAQPGDLHSEVPPPSVWIPAGDSAARDFVLTRL